MRTKKEDRIKHVLALEKTKDSSAKKFVLNLIEDINDFEKLNDFIIQDLKRALQDASCMKANVQKGGDHLKILFSNGLKIRMRGLGFNQAKIARESKVSAKYISELLDGRRNPTSNQMEKIAEALGCTAMDLLDIGEAESKEQRAINSRLLSSPYGEII